MQARMANPAMTLPGAFQALQALSEATRNHGVSDETLGLVHLRASQINGCSVCVDMHAKELDKSGTRRECIFAVGAWRDAPYFTEPERAALALAECVTRLSDRSDPVPDEVWQEAARHYDENGLAAIVLATASINVWNRLNAATRQVAGQWS
jgi:AhpD family alkylhydroperoxidase